MTLELQPIPSSDGNKILIKLKALLGIPNNVVDFDAQLVSYINTAIYTLTELGVGEAGYQTTVDSGSFDEFLPAESFVHDTLQMYIFMKVRLLFDPPTSSFVLTSLESQIKELEWRLTDYSTPS